MSPDVWTSGLPEALSLKAPGTKRKASKATNPASFENNVKYVSVK